MSSFGIGFILAIIINHNLSEIIEVLDWKIEVGSLFLLGLLINFVSIFSFKKSKNIQNINVLPSTTNPVINIKHDHEWSIPILIGDSLCNFSDGLIITSSFLSCGVNSGILMTIAVLLHEIPHEIGDFALLLESGLKFKNAILLNLLSGSAIYLGYFFSLQP